MMVIKLDLAVKRNKKMKCCNHNCNQGRTCPTRKVLASLPKAKLFSIKIGGSYKKPYFAKFRGANFMRWQIGRIRVQHRMPWLLSSAMSLHPHLFKEL